MLKFLIRCTLFIVGLAFILDIALPTRTEQSQVDQHTSQTQMDHRPTRTVDSRWADTSYKIHLIGGSVSSCSVGYSAYAGLKDGDSVEVQATRLFKTCIRISRGTDVIEAEKHWRLLALAFGLGLIAVGIGWLKNDDDDRDDLSIRLG